MPELPEVETISRQLNTVLKGQVIKDIKVLRSKSFKGRVNQLVGKKIKGVGRRAKLIIIELEGDLSLLVHLKMTGQLIYQESGIRHQELGKVHYRDHKPHFKFDHRLVGGHPTADWVKQLPTSHTRVIVTLTKGRLFFNDMRVFGWMKLVDKAGLTRELANYGPDITDKQGLNEHYFFGVLKKSARAAKLVVTDQKKLAGVGNIYANDGLFCAGVDPRRPANKLRRVEATRLLNCLRKVMEKGIRYGGATASDDKFVQITGLGGKYQEHFLVYDQEGKACQRRGCSGVIKKIKLGGRGTYFCPKCQK